MVTLVDRDGLPIELDPRQEEGRVDELVREGVRLCFVDVGKGAPPIVLVHDLGTDHTCLSTELERFRQRHRVVAVDLRGHGESDKPERSYTVSLFADDLAWLAYELGLYRPVVVGHGLGGAIALDLAARYPGLLLAVVLDAPILRTLSRGGLPDHAEVSLTASTAPRHVLASALEHLATWDADAALAACTVPVIHTETGASGATSPDEVIAAFDSIVSDPRSDARDRPY